MTTRILPIAVLVLAACGGPQPGPRGPSNASTAIVDPAQLYCAGRGGQVIARVVNNRRADLCRLPDGRTVSAADLIRSSNDL
ncbi:MAG: DUF333 domain-containing protein [Paracoccus sp. (in: a-proteobacteria)]|nr:DUF333 domain-containing protein [Paracoccus sp. (in: a-proteobacteria)]